MSVWQNARKRYLVNSFSVLPKLVVYYSNCLSFLCTAQHSALYHSVELRLRVSIRSYSCYARERLFSGYDREF